MELHIHLFLLLLLLLPPLLFSSSTSALSQYQTLTLTPLHSPPPLDPDFSTRTSHPQSLENPELHFRLAHRDSLHVTPSSSPQNLLRLRLDRDSARVSFLSPNSTRRTGGTFSGPVTSGLAQGTGEYFAHVGVGTPPVPSLLVLDTGSDVVWLQCQPCRRTSSSAAKSSSSSSVVFGSSAVPTSGPVAFTPMLRNPKMDTFYYVELVGVSVGGTRVAGASASDLKMDPATGRGGVIVDSGTSVTRLATPAYNAVRDAFRDRAAGLGLGLAAGGGFSLFDTCYDLAGRKEVKVPTVAMHFAGGAAVSFPAENYLIPVESKGTFCFDFAGTDGGVSIIGNIQQQGFQVVFDVGRSRVGFAPRGC